MTPEEYDELGLVSDHNDDSSAAVIVLTHFINDATSASSSCSTKERARRRTCPSCTASRSMYCYDCCEVLIPIVEGPKDLQELQFPCSVDIILDDRRSSATGVLAYSVLKTIGTRKKNNNDNYDVDFRLLDQARGDGIPDYSNQDGVYFLFPSDTSVGISSVAGSIQRLVVLDCKWTKSYLRKDPRLVQLPKLHLDNPPSESFYWRWHNSGSGMLCTIEALYFAGWEVAIHHGWTLQQRRKLVNLLWIFKLQRLVIQEQYESGNGHRFIPYVPFSKDGKEFARKFRDQSNQPVENNTKTKSEIDG